MKFLNTLGDRINPIVVKETRQAVSSRFVAWSVILFLAIELITMSVYLLGESARAEMNLQDMRTGREVFAFLQGILMVSCMVLIPMLTGGRLAGERSDVNVDLLFISSLSPRAIMAGKLYAATALALLLFSACAPYMTFAYMLRGLDIPTIAVVLVSDLITVMFGTMFALLVAAIPASRGFKAILGLGAVFVLIMVTIGVQRVSTAFLESEMNLDFQSRDTWLALAGVYAAILGVIGLMFFWATALISPLTSNRALLVRLYTLGYWIFGLVACAIWSLEDKHAGPMYVWGTLGTLLFSFQFLVSCSERDRWGPRVTRKIPHGRPLRVLAFFFYSGSAGGMLFGALGCAATIGIMSLWCDEYGYTVRIRGHEREYAVFTSLLAGYTYCFCMSAVLVRRMFDRGAFNPALTWLVALILFGLASIFPGILREAVLPSGPRYQSRDEYIWMFLTSPVVMMNDAFESPNVNHQEMTMVFLVIWGVAITMVNFPWMLDQVMRFHPPKKAIATAELDESS
jgi:hypothetical protein